MKLSRRDFIKRAAITGAGVALLPRIAWPFNQSPLGIKKFVTGLPGLGPAGANELGNYIAALAADTTTYPGTDYYEIVAKQFSQTIYNQGRATLSPKFWGYADKKTGKSTYLGGLIVATRARPVKIKAYNGLPMAHILPVDLTQMDLNEPKDRFDRIAVHLHGGLVQWQNDGGPYAWYSNAANQGGFVHGSSFMNGADPGAAIYDYPNNQSARLQWYHDHAHGLTRLNAYAGIATGYLITDAAEAGLIDAGVLPNLLGGLYTYGIPLVIQDKGFWDPASNDPGYASVAPGAVKGSLWYPHVYEVNNPGNSELLSDPNLCAGGTGRWDRGPATSDLPPVSAVAEAFFDTNLVNGAPYPTITLPPGRFRFRLLNGSQARFYNLQAYVKDGNADGISLAPLPSGEVDPNGNPILAPTNPAGPAFIQVGNEGGFLPAPVVFSRDGTNVNSNRVMGFDLDPNSPTVGNATQFNLLLAPAERADIIMDFRGYEGQTIVIYTSNWLEGLLLCAFYLMLAVGTFFPPA